MTSSKGNLFHVTDILWGKFTGDGFPSQSPATRNLSVFFICARTVEQTMETPVIWDVIAFMMTSLWWTVIGPRKTWVKSTSTQPQQCPTDGLYILADTVGRQQNPAGHLFINPLRAKFFRVNINIYLHFISFLHIDMTQVLKFFLKWDKDVHILCSQYHGCWCPGDVRSQGISSNDFDLVKLR